MGNVFRTLAGRDASEEMWRIKVINSKLSDYDSTKLPGGNDAVMVNLTIFVNRYRVHF